MIKIIRLHNWSIASQLRLEEALLRHDTGNWCVVNALPAPTIVLGLSGKASELIHGNLVRRDQVPVLRRFTGGGTVVVGKGTIVATLIANKHDTPCGAFPRDIMAYTGDIYADVFHRLIGERVLSLREHDYVIDGSMKVGGNAQSIIRSRWLHHTSFLWDFNDKDMRYLTLPSRRPDYRRDRDHSAFITRLWPRILQRHNSFSDAALLLASELTQRLSSDFDEVISDDNCMQEALAILEARGTNWFGGTYTINHSDL